MTRKIAHYKNVLKKHGRPFLYSLFPEEEAAKIQRQEKQVRWAEAHWPLLAAYAWQQYEHGPGYVFVIPRNPPLVFPPPDLIVGRCQLYYKEYEELKEPPEKSVNLTFVCEYPKAQWVFEERFSLALEPPPPVAYKQYPLPAVEEAIQEPPEPHTPPDYRDMESFFLEGLNAQGIVTKWKETPWLPRRDFWLGGTDDDPEGCRPLTDDCISIYKHMAHVWRWSRFQRNRTTKNIITPPRQAKRRHWARRRWLALAAFAWERFLKDGPGWVLAKRLRRRSTSPWLLDGYQVDYAMGSPDYDPHRSICLRFDSTESGRNPLALG